MQLKDIQKGWFNLEESNTEVYSFSKLKKFLGFINFVMQDTMRLAVQSGLEKYKNFILKACEPHVKMTSTSDVALDYTCNNTVDPAAAAARAKKPPLFLLDLATTEPTPEKPLSTFCYSSTPESFTDSVLQYFDKSLGSSQKLTRVERKVMKNLFWSRDPIMTAVHPTEAWVVSYREAIAAAMQSSTTGVLRDYLKFLDPLTPFLQTNVEQFLEEIEIQYGGKQDPNVEVDEHEEEKVRQRGT